MRHRVFALIIIGVLSTAALSARDVKVRGMVLDSVSRAPVSGATVTAAGDQSRQDEITDDQGFFRLLLDHATPGDLFRLRVQKNGYAVYDRQVVASEEIPLQILLTPVKERRQAHPANAPAAASPVVAAMIARLRNGDPESRIQAIAALEKRAPDDRAAMAAIIRALEDSNPEVQQSAVWAVGRLKPSSGEAVRNLAVVLSGSPDYSVRAAAAAALGHLGSPARNAAPDLLAGLSDEYTPVIVESFNALIALGYSSDPKVVSTAIQLLSSERTSGDARSLLLKHRPLPSLFVGPLITALPNTGSCTSCLRDMVSVLLGTGEPGQRALADLTAKSEPQQQAGLALSWLEVEGKARPLVLNCINVTEVARIFVNRLDSVRPDAVPQPDARAVEDLDSNGEALRAATALLLLDLDPGGKAWSVLTKGLLSASRDNCIYSAEMLERLPAARVRTIVPQIVAALSRCHSNPSLALGICADEALKQVGGLLTTVGDGSTTKLLQPLLSDTDERVRRTAQEAIAGISPK